MAFIESLKKFDAHPKTLREFQIQTVNGGVVSILAILLMLILFYGEYSLYSQTTIVDRLHVHSKLTEKLKINFDITFHHIPCLLLDVDANDQIGNSQKNVVHELYKTRLDEDGKPLSGPTSFEMARTLKTEKDLHQHIEEKDTDEECGDCYGAGDEGECCNTCEKVQEVYRRKGWSFSPEGISQCRTEHMELLALAKAREGCRLHGDILVHTTTGNFHFAPAEHIGSSLRQLNEIYAAKQAAASAAHEEETTGESGATGETGAAGAAKHDVVEFTFQNFNISHTIHRLSFGAQFPGLRNPLDGEGRDIEDGHGMYQYFLQVVPTVYKYLDQDEAATTPSTTPSTPTTAPSTPNSPSTTTNDDSTDSGSEDSEDTSGGLGLADWSATTAGEGGAAAAIVSNQYSCTEHLRHVSPQSGRGLPGVYFVYDISPVRAVFEERRGRTAGQCLTSVLAIVGGVLTGFGVVDTLVSLSIEYFRRYILKRSSVLSV